MALHPASVTDGDKVTVLFGTGAVQRPYVRKLTVIGHLKSGEVHARLGQHSIVLDYAEYGVTWAKGWDRADDLLAAFLLDLSAR